MVPLNDLSRITKEDLSAISQLSQSGTLLGWVNNRNALPHWIRNTAALTGHLVSGHIQITCSTNSTG
jgi:riboflavin synthase alpha subunit